MPSTTLTTHTYPSKKNLVLIIGVYGLLLAITIAGYKSMSPFSLLFHLALIAFFTHLFLSTKYTVKEATLKVQSGFLVNKDIDILAIRKVKETHSWWSAPALSPERVEIFYNTYDSVVISPQDAPAFIAHLLQVNPAIVVEKKD